MLTFQAVDRMKGQVSFEFMIITLIVLSILLLVFATTTKTQIDSQQDLMQRRIANLCQDLAEKIDKAIYYGRGFSQELDLPNNIYGIDYNIKIQNNKTLVCSTEKFSIVKIIIENEIRNETAQVPFFISLDATSISNEGGVVVIK